MDLTEFVLRVEHPIFTLQAVPGDEILVRPGHPRPVVLVRTKFPAYGELAAAIADGAVTPATLSQSEALAALVALATIAPPRRPRRRRRSVGA